MPQLDYNNGSFFLQFDYNPTLYASVMTVEGRRWNPIIRRWTFPATVSIYHQIVDIFQKSGLSLLHTPSLNNFLITRQEELKKDKIISKKLAKRIGDYQFKTTPYKHQERAFRFFAKQDSGALFFDCGLGKTKSIIDIMQFRLQQKQIKLIIVIAPKSVLPVWESEFSKHGYFRKDDIMILTGDKVETRKKFIKMNRTAKVIVVNYDIIYRILDTLIQRQPDMLICDESTKIKTHTTKRTKAIWDLSKHIRYRFILTGTPITQKLVDLYSQFKIVHSTLLGRSYYAFRNRYCIMGGYKHKEIVGYKNIEHLNNLIAPFVQRATKDECPDIPPKIYETRYCDMTTDQEEAYKQMKHTLRVKLLGGETVTAQIVLTQLLRLTQITSGFMITEKAEKIAFKRNNKLMALQEVLDEIQGKVVIWCRFKHDVEHITKILKGGHLTLTGDTYRNRGDIVKQFQEDKEIRYFVMTSAGGYGLNLQVANTLIFFSNDFSLEQRLQAEDRIHRIGSKSTTIMDIVIKGTIDEYILKCLREHIDFSQNVLKKLDKILSGEGT